MLKLKYKNATLEVELAQLNKKVLNGKLASSSTGRNVQSMEEKVDALKIKLNNAKAEVVALPLDVEVIQMTLSSAKSTLETENDDFVTCQAQIWKLTQLYESKKAMQLENLSSSGNEQRSKVKCLLNTLADMQRALDDQAVGNVVENLKQEVLGDNPNANVGRGKCRCNLLEPTLSYLLVQSVLQWIPRNNCPCLWTQFVEAAFRSTALRSTLPTHKIALLIKCFRHLPSCILQPFILELTDITHACIHTSIFNILDIF